MSNINLLNLSDNNPLPKRIGRDSRAIANLRGAWRMSDDDHEFMMEEARNREEGNKYDEELALEVRRQEEEASKWRAATNNGDDMFDDSEDSS